ncbi:ATP-binding protein [Ruania sp. N2-46]|uniref:ATP-binding protein n=2 Tax=Occultella gossypii TaxID=2800820 RepID=A0ABS7SGE1_9MICO|nr:ATP-binding protein [Occultella gossypii]
MAMRAAGDDAGHAARLAELADYNRYDCVSTLRLRDWLLEQRDRTLAVLREAALALGAGASPMESPETSTAGIATEPAMAVEEETEETTAQILARALLARTSDPAAPLLAAALEYHRREDEPFWRAHFERLDAPRRDWVDARDVLEVHGGRVVEDWSGPEGRRPTRVLELTGALGTGSIVGAGSEVYCVYPPPVPDGMRVPEGHERATSGARVISRGENSDGEDVLVIAEWLARDVVEHDVLPVLITPGAPPSAASLRSAIELVAQAVVDDGTAASTAPPAPTMLTARATDANTASSPTVVEGGGGEAATIAVETGVRLEPERDEERAVGAPPRPSTGPDTWLLPAQAALDVLRRVPPRQRHGGTLPHAAVSVPGPGSAVDGVGGDHIGADHISAVTDAVLGADDSYVAVQGPPGTGKTYLGTRVIAALVQRFGWRVGVVAQSHAVVEHFLGGVIEAGVPGAQVGKRGGSIDASIPTDFRPAVEHDRNAPPWVRVDTYQHQEFLERHGSAGAVIGGTAWDFTNRRRFAVGDLDLLVVDEAGQFSLANTIAVATAARRLLLLGDPQQLPQVSQGTHDAPVDVSALGWLTEGHATLPPSRGYFLDRTWRLHPALCEAVSTLAYDHQLHSHPRTARRHLEGLDAGVHVVRVPHRGNVVDSPEESAEVVAQIQALLGKRWTDSSDRANSAESADRADVADRADRADSAEARPLAPADILVVAAYNAQVQRIRHDLADAGLEAVRVGTVDKFQGQEAAVVLLSLAASSADDAPRGLGFVLSRNRLNVAISRGKWAAIVIRSPGLTRHLPWDPNELTALGAFITLCSDARERRSRRH